MDVFMSNLAFALDAELEIPVFVEGDERILDAPRCMVISNREAAYLDCIVMSNDGFAAAKGIAEDIAGKLTSIRADVHPHLHLVPIERHGRFTVIDADAPYAQGCQMKILFDIETSMPNAA